MAEATGRVKQGSGKMCKSLHDSTPDGLLLEAGGEEGGRRNG